MYIHLYISTSKDWIEGASFMASTVYVGGTSIWASIVAVISGISSLSSLEKLVPSIRNVPPIYLSILSGVLPALGLILLMSMVPVVFRYISINIVGVKTKSQVVMSCMQW